MKLIINYDKRLLSISLSSSLPARGISRKASKVAGSSIPKNGFIFKNMSLFIYINLDLDYMLSKVFTLR